MTPFNNRIFNLIKNEIVSYERYEAGHLLAMDRSGPKLMCWPCQKFSYAYWVNHINDFTSIKVSAAENIKPLYQAFKKFKIVGDIQIFYSAKRDYSFDAHKDVVNVYLYVVKGRKKVKVRDRIHILRPGQGIYIPKGHMHQVFNDANTWAVSLAVK